MNDSSVLMCGIVRAFTGDPTEAMRAVSEIAAKPFTPEDTHLVEHPAGHLTLKRLILNDAGRIKQGELGTCV